MRDVSQNRQADDSQYAQNPALVRMVASLLCDYAHGEELPTQFAKRLLHAINQAVVDDRKKLAAPPLKKATRTERFASAFVYVLEPRQPLAERLQRAHDVLYLSETFCKLLALKRRTALRPMRSGNPS